MKRIPVDSSMIRSIGYKESEGLMEVEFMNHAVYQYRAVPLSVHKAIMSAPSKGKTFNQLVKEPGTFPYTKVGGP